MHDYSITVVGSTGYAGRELVGLLQRHSKIGRIDRYASKGDSATGVAAFEMDAIRKRRPDIVVLATEHELSLEIVPELLELGLRVVDMSGAFRLPDASLYPNWYGFDHTSPNLLRRAIYGLPEFNEDEIRKAQLVANPGCYATAALLPLIPLLRAGVVRTDHLIVIDGKSGVSGAGKKPSARTHFCEVAESVSAYGVLGHRHTPEIAAYLSIDPRTQLVFTPHLLPLRRGILCTTVLKVVAGSSPREVLERAYVDRPFVRVLPSGQFPGIADVAYTNECWIGLGVDGDRAVIVSAIDNLVKGAAGQALQNVNLMLGLNPSVGLAA